MGFKKGEGGRPKGLKNKRNRLVEEIADRFKIDPFEVLMMVAAGDWKSLGFESKTKTTFTMNGIEIEEDNVPLKERVQAAKEAAKYLYSQKQSVALSTADTGLEVVIKDYRKKDEA